jgi:hypothetical protein
MDIVAITQLLVSSAAWKIAAFVVIGKVIADILTQIASIIFEYIALKTDLIGIGTSVEYNGKIGIIRHIGLRRLTVDFKQADGSCIKMYMLLSEWRKMHIVHQK